MQTQIKYLATLGNRQFVIESNAPLSQKQINTAVQKIHDSESSPRAAGERAAEGMIILGTATCGGPYIKNSTHTLTGSVISGGTAPFTYTWVITPPIGTPTTLTGPSQTYTFALDGTYTINLSVSDSCSGGAKTDSASCNVVVVVTSVCIEPSCKISITSEE